MIGLQKSLSEKKILAFGTKYLERIRGESYVCWFGLCSLGLKRGDVCSIAGESLQGVVFADLGIICWRRNYKRSLPNRFSHAS